MPTLRNSLMHLDPARWGQPISSPAEPPALRPVALPAHLSPSSTMITSLPALSTEVDGITRQFYRSGRVPMRRVVSPR